MAWFFISGCRIWEAKNDTCFLLSEGANSVEILVWYKGGKLNAGQSGIKSIKKSRASVTIWLVVFGMACSEAEVREKQGEIHRLADCGDNSALARHALLRKY